LYLYQLVGADGFRAIFHDEGLCGLYRGTSLALFGVSNGALQFMGYEKMKGWAFERKQRRVAKLGRAWTTDDEKLVRDYVPSTRPLTK
jgi:solute carrier family 25 folate transporter 32